MTDDKQYTVGTLNEPWRSWMGSWRDELDPDLPVVFYEDNGIDSPDQWADCPHVCHLRRRWVVAVWHDWRPEGFWERWRRVRAARRGTIRMEDTA